MKTFMEDTCHQKGPTMEQAGNMVGLDLQQPIDCSQMQIHQISEEPKFEEYHDGMYVERKTILFAHVFNEYGEREELTIEFILKSQRAPKRVVI